MINPTSRCTIVQNQLIYLCDNTICVAYFGVTSQIAQLWVDKGNLDEVRICYKLLWIPSL